MKAKIGDTLPEFVVPNVSSETMKDWSLFLADPNPIHLDVEVVKAKGLGDRLINQGPINVAFVINLLTSAFPDGRIERLTSRFLDNVYAGERVVARGTVIAISGDRLECDFELVADERGIVNAGTATILLPNQGE